MDKEKVETAPESAAEFKTNLDEMRASRELELKLRKELRDEYRAEYERLLEIWKMKELAVLESKQDEQINLKVGEFIDQYKKEMTPPTVEEVQAILDQEYITFNIKVDVHHGAGKGTQKTFVIAELPQEIEKHFYQLFRNKIETKLETLSSFDQSLMDMPFEKKARAMLELIDDGFDVLAEATLCVLNPFGEDKDVDIKWLQRNLSSNRMWDIVESQILANRIRDFFSKLSQSGKRMTTIANSRSIQASL